MNAPCSPTPGCGKTGSDALSGKVGWGRCCSGDSRSCSETQKPVYPLLKQYVLGVGKDVSKEIQWCHF